MSAVVRYVLASFVRSQRWVAPVLVFLCLLAVLLPGGGPPLSLVAGAAAALFPLGAWMTYLVVGDEDLVQEAMTVTSAGGVERVRLAKFVSSAALTAGLGGLPLVIVLVPLLIDLATGTRGVADVVRVAAAGSVAIVANAVTGSASGLLFVRPVVVHRGWSVLGIVTVTLGALLVPGLPPMRSMLESFNRDTDLLLPVVLIAGVAAVATAVLVAVGLALTARRA